MTIMKRLMIGAGLAALLATSAMTSAIAQAYDPAWGTGNVQADPNRFDSERYAGVSGYAQQPEGSYAYAPRGRSRHAARGSYAAEPHDNSGYGYGPHVMEGHSDVAPQ